VPFAGLDAHEVRVEMGCLECSGGAVETIEQVRPPHRLINHDLLGSGLGTAARLGDQQAKLDTRAVLQVAVHEVDLEPVPYENGNLVEDEDVLHALLLSAGGSRSVIPAYRPGEPVASADFARR
jgi:hypothetical protein